MRGCKNVYDSFIKYTEEEDMVGDNQYNAEGHGMQVCCYPSRLCVGYHLDAQEHALPLLLPFLSATVRSGVDKKTH